MPDAVNCDGGAIDSSTLAIYVDVLLRLEDDGLDVAEDGAAEVEDDAARVDVLVGTLAVLLAVVRTVLLLLLMLGASLQSEASGPRQPPGLQFGWQGKQPLPAAKWVPAGQEATQVSTSRKFTHARSLQSEAPSPLQPVRHST
jgi:hypothetical protein